MRHAVRDEEGQAVVEFALVLPLFLVLLLGLAQVGLILNTQQQLVTVARQGARTYALSADPTSTVAAIRLAGRQLAAFDGRTTVRIADSGQRSAIARNDIEFSIRSSGGGIFGHIAALISEALARARLELQRRTVRRGDWVTITVTYSYPNPIRASVLGFRLPEWIALSSSATARIEYDPNIPVVPVVR